MSSWWTRSSQIGQVSHGRDGHATKLTCAGVSPVTDLEVAKFTNWSNFVREAWLIDKREMEQAQLFGTADERGCTPMFGAAHRRASAVSYPRRYEVCSLFIASDPHTAQSCTGETPVPRWLRGMAVPAMIQNLTDL